MEDISLPGWKPPVTVTGRHHGRLVTLGVVTALLFLVSGVMAVIVRLTFSGPSLQEGALAAGLIVGHGSLFFLAAFLAVRPYEQCLVALAALLGLVLLFPPLIGGLVILAGVLFLWGAARSVAAERGRGLMLSPRRASSAGRAVFVLALSLMLSGGYFISIRTLSWEGIAARLAIGRQTTTLVLTLLSRVRPEWHALNSSQATVDDFLTAQWNERTDGGFAELPPDLRGRIHELEQQGVVVRLNETFLSDVDTSARSVFLQNGRERLGEMIGRTLTGQEPMADVLAEGVERRIVLLFQSAQFQERVPDGALPLTLTLLFFLTLSPLYALLALVWQPLVAGLFALLRRSGAIRCQVRVVKQEYLVS